MASPYIGRKEDAYMNYMITTGIVNALTRKFLIVVKKQPPSTL